MKERNDRDVSVHVGLFRKQQMATRLTFLKCFFSYLFDLFFFW